MFWNNFAWFSQRQLDQANAEVLAEINKGPAIRLQAELDTMRASQGLTNHVLPSVEQGVMVLSGMVDKLRAENLRLDRQAYFATQSASYWHQLAKTYAPDIPESQLMHDWAAIVMADHPKDYAGRADNPNVQEAWKLLGVKQD